MTSLAGVGGSAGDLEDADSRTDRGADMGGEIEQADLHQYKALVYRDPAVGERKPDVLGRTLAC